MNIQHRIKKISPRFAALSVAIVLLAVFSFWSHYKSASGAQGDPEAQMQDLLGVERNSFSIDESGLLNMRAYSDNVGYPANLDIILAIDNSGSMLHPVPDLSEAKYERANRFAKEFIDSIGNDDGTRVGIVRIKDPSNLITGLTAVTSQADKNALKAIIDVAGNFNTPSGGTDIRGAVVNSNSELKVGGGGNGRAGSPKYIVLLSDMGENGGTCLSSGNPTNCLNQNYFFDNPSWSENINASVSSGSVLQQSIDLGIKYVGIYINPRGETNIVSPPTTAGEGWVDPGYFATAYGNAGLMRFAALKSNYHGITPSADSWKVDFNNMPEVDNKRFFQFYDDIINKIYYFIRDDGPKFHYLFRLSPQVQLDSDQVQSAIDKAGYIVNIREFKEIPGEEGYYEIVTDSVPYERLCALGDTYCRDHGELREDGNVWVTQNYLDIKIKLKMAEPGIFDVLSNYIGCASGPLHQVSQDSRVEYLDPDDVVRDQRYFKSVCLNVSESSPSVIKTSYATDPGGDLANPTGVRQASFDAGDDVWIVLEIDDSTSGRTDFVIKDTVPASVSGAIEYSFYHGADGPETGEVVISSSKALFKGQDSDDAGVVIGPLSSGKNYIKYKYKI